MNKRHDFARHDFARLEREFRPTSRLRLMLKDRALLIDRLQKLFDRPSVISQHQGLTVRTELSPDALREFIEATRGRAGLTRMEESPLPRGRRLDG